MRKSNAFTLIELLVVISIIALLIALLLPVLSGARLTARMATDLSYARQWTTASYAYASDHKGVLPPGDNGENFIITWVWLRKDSWDALNRHYGMPEEGAMCQSYADMGENERPVFFYEAYAGYKNVGWIYYGNRNDISLGAKYITPKTVEDAHASSNTLIACFHYDGETVGRPYGSWVPHRQAAWGAQFYPSGTLQGDIRNSNFSGLNVGMIDGSASFVPYEELEWFQQAEALYYKPTPGREDL